jgi:hypothetical protein
MARAPPRRFYRSGEGFNSGNRPVVYQREDAPDAAKRNPGDHPEVHKTRATRLNSCSAFAVTSPTPGMLVKMSNRWHRSESAFAQCFEASIDRCDLAVDLTQPLSELTFDERRGGDGLAVEGCDAVLDECVAGVDEFPHGLDRLAGGGARLEVENCAHAGKHKGVAPVSLGEFSCGLGEASGLTGIDLDPRQAGLDSACWNRRW